MLHIISVLRDYLISDVKIIYYMSFYGTSLSENAAAFYK